MAARTRCVIAHMVGRDRRLRAVTSPARFFTARDERVRLMTIEAAVVARRMRARRRRMTFRTRIPRSRGRCVTGVAIEAASAAAVLRVLGRDFFVTRVAVARRDGRLLVDGVAFLAVGIGVNRDRR